MSERITAGVIGGGFVGPVHVEAMRRNEAEVVGLVGSSPDAGRAKAAEIGVPAVGSLDDLLALPGLTSVHVATPNHLHASMVEQILAVGEHAVCEKPLAMTAAEGESGCCAPQSGPASSTPSTSTSASTRSASRRGRWSGRGSGAALPDPRVAPPGLAASGDQLELAPGT